MTTEISRIELVLNAPAPVITGGGVDFGFCQSELGHNTWFGAADQYEAIVAGIAASGARRVRLAAWWATFEPTTRGVFSWDGLDRAMDLCEQHGLEPLVVITAPAPAYADPTIADYANACAVLAARYGAEGTGQLRHYEIWNEANQRAHYAPFDASFGVEHYTDLLKAASAAIRAADSRAFILAVGLMSTEDFEPNDIAPATFLQGIYDNGGRGSFDAVAYHWYSHTPDFSDWQAPTTTQPHYLSMLATRDVMVAEGDTDKSMWVTEMGLPRAAITDPAVRADWLADQIELVHRLPFVTTFFVYNWRDSDTDQSDPNNTYGMESYDGATTWQPARDALAGINAAVPGRVPKSGVGLDRLTADVRASLAKVDTVGGGSELVNLGSRWQTEKQLYPLPGASPAPLTTDGGIVDGMPAPTTGLKFVPWTSLGSFNYQGMYMVPAGPALNQAMGLTAGQAGQNASTPRKYNFGTLTGEFMPSTIDLRFATDSTRVIPVWINYSGYSGTAYTDCHMMVEHEGVMKHLSNGADLNGLPRTQRTGGGVKRRELTFLERRWRRHRLMLPGFCYFAGVYIDTLATIRQTPNLDLFMHNGDSWNEGLGASYSDNLGGGFPSGSYMCLGLPQYLSFETGQCHGTYAQGGTGESNANGTTGGSATGYAGTMSSAMWTDSRVNDIITKFSAQYPIQLDIGGWNDSNALGTPYKDKYKARVVARYTKEFAAAEAAGREIKAITATIQPVDWNSGDGGYRDLYSQGQIEAAAAFPGKVLGSVYLGDMWDNTTTKGQRSILCLPQSGFYIHLNVSGYTSVAGFLAASIAKMQCPASYLEKMRAA